MSTQSNPRRRIVLLLISGLITIQIASLAILVANSARLIHDSHAELFYRNTAEVVTLLGQSLISGLVTRDRATLADNLELLHSNEDIVYAAVFDSTGGRLAYIGTMPAEFVVDSGFASAEADGVLDMEHEIQLAGQILGYVRAGFSIKRVVQLAERTLWENSLIVLSEITLFVAGAALVGLYLIRRIRTLTAGALALRDGALEHRISVQSHDELAQVGEAFNDLASHLQQTQAALRIEHEALETQVERTTTLLAGVNAIIYEMSGSPPAFTFLSGSPLNLQGYSLADWQRPDFWEQVMDPRDRARMDAAMTRWSSRLGDFSVEFRMRNRRNELRWLRQIGTVTLDRDNVILRGLILDVTEEKSISEIETARDRAMEANKAKSAFIASMSHELRTPLNAIIGYSEMIEEELTEGRVPAIEALRTDVKRIHDSGRHLLAMINDILDFSKLEAGKFQLHVGVVQISSVVRSAADMILPLAQNRNNRLQVEVEPGLPDVTADEKRLFQILVNLLSNACKFTEQGTITIRAQRAAGFVRVDVADTGLGIRQEDQARLFQEFSQLDSEAAGRPQGTGLGLTISQRLARLMGGDIALHSVYGQGSTFSVTIPIAGGGNRAATTAAALRNTPVPG